jgi:hypothetical protein
LLNRRQLQGLANNNTHPDESAFFIQALQRANACTNFVSVCICINCPLDSLSSLSLNDFLVVDFNIDSALLWMTNNNLGEGPRIRKQRESYVP